jgi:hypothetical protein
VRQQQAQGAGCRVRVCNAGRQSQLGTQTNPGSGNGPAQQNTARQQIKHCAAQTRAKLRTRRA